MSKTTLTAQEAADYLGVSYWHLLELAKKRLLPHVHLGRRVLFRQETLDSWLMDEEAKSLLKPAPVVTQGILRKVH